MNSLDAHSEEAIRVAAVNALGLMDTDPTPEFDIFSQLASRIFNVPVAAITLLDADRQWLKASVGLNFTETSRAVAFCTHAIAEPDRIFVVPDASVDPRFADNPFVTGDLNVRFYAGAPLRGPTGHVVGALCVIDRVPRTFSETDFQQLRLLALGVENALRLHALNRHIQTGALRDKLTGLANRDGLDVAADASLAGNAALATDPDRAPRRLGCLLIGLDNCKSINDLFGYGGGDAALVHLATRLQRLAAPRDLLARFDGDIFCLLTPLENQSANLPLPGLQSAELEAEYLQALADRLHDIIAEPADIEGQSVVLSVSIGIAVVPNTATSLAPTLEEADIALQDAKRSGRGSTSLAAPVANADAGARIGFLSMQASLRHALFPPGREPFCLAMQPIFHAHNLELCGFEALVRWPLNDSHVRQPNDFIPAAEATGMIVQIDHWALNEACRIAATWPSHIQVSSNLSAANFFAGGIADHVARTLDKHRLDPRRLKLEITESLLLRDPSRVQRILTELRRLGVSVLLDDFGAGHASIAYLRDYTLDGLKIDRSFIAAIGTDQRGEAFLAAIAQMGSALNLQTTAEGVETRHQLEALQRYGVSLLQGYHLGRPMSVRQVQETFVF